MRVSEYFTLAEVEHSNEAVRLGINNSLPASLYGAIRHTAARADVVRKILNVPMIISSWYRCSALNRALKSPDSSQHVKGEAIDFYAPAFGSPAKICKTLLQNKELISWDQLILEHTWVHISFKYPGTPGRLNRGEVLTLLQDKTYAVGLTDFRGNPV